jgi:hypothetical protein
MASGESKSSGFTVTDRRSFSEGGDPGADGPGAGGAKVATAVTGSAPGLDLGEDASGEVGGSGSLPAVDFHTFILSLGSSALLHLGELEHPDAGGPRKDLPLAKHTIDILEMLDQKTKGNLTPAEEKLMTSLLYDLRLRYVEASKTK